MRAALSHRPADDAELQALIDAAYANGGWPTLVVDAADLVPCGEIARIVGMVRNTAPWATVEFAGRRYQ